MTDVHSKITRSYNMSRIRGKNTGPELIVRKFLFSKGFRYRIHKKDLPGKPDIVLKKYKTVVNVNGCFWHGHENCKYAVIPKTRTEWWINKISKTKKRDLKNQLEISKKGWNVINIWECELNKKNVKETFSRLLMQLKYQLDNCSSSI